MGGVVVMSMQGREELIPRPCPDFHLYSAPYALKGDVYKMSTAAYAIAIPFTCSFFPYQTLLVPELVTSWKYIILTAVSGELYCTGSSTAGTVFCSYLFPLPFPTNTLSPSHALNTVHAFSHPLVLIRLFQQ